MSAVTIIAIIIAAISYVIYFLSCFVLGRTTMQPSKVLIGAMLATVSLGSAVSSLFVAIGARDSDLIIGWGIAGAIFGTISFMLLWARHKLLPYLVAKIRRIL